MRREGWIGGIPTVDPCSISSCSAEPAYVLPDGSVVCARHGLEDWRKTHPPRRIQEAPEKKPLPKPIPKPKKPVEVSPPEKIPATAIDTKPKRPHKSKLRAYQSRVNTVSEEDMLKALQTALTDGTVLPPRATNQG